MRALLLPVAGSVLGGAAGNAHRSVKRKRSPTGGGAQDRRWQRSYLSIQLESPPSRRWRHGPPGLRLRAAVPTILLDDDNSDSESASVSTVCDPPACVGKRPLTGTLTRCSHSGQLAQDQRLPRHAWLPDQWVTKGFLRGGAFGAIVGAVRPANRDESVVVKVLSTETGARAEAALRELYNLMFFTRSAPHPNVIPLQLAWYKCDLLHLVLPRYDQSLADLIELCRDAQAASDDGSDCADEDGPADACVPMLARTCITLQICAGLAHLHLWAVHRDVKTSNVVVRGRLDDPLRLSACLIDLGATRRVEDAGRRGCPPLTPARVVATEGYRAPETYDSRDVENYRRTGLLKERRTAKYAASSDVFAVGCVHSEMVTGDELFEDSEALLQQLEALGSEGGRASLLRRTHQPQLLSGAVSAAEVLLLCRMLDSCPQRRPTAAECHRSLRNAAGISGAAHPTAASFDDAVYQEPRHVFSDSEAGICMLRGLVQGLVEDFDAGP
eukprot:TRINITY_DN19150_c0_g1_i1.p1 TRINITY_DN19150_c0_g1~~TRINITY_DN19150_c0_g1_i1.p1  ORF type:complete len:522 (+),score=117.73 TRINITY_DN19150_c0_g1_i1:71-1567(+)